jgi:hypothetical protein
MKLFVDDSRCILSAYISSRDVVYYDESLWTVIRNFEKLESVVFKYYDAIGKFPHTISLNTHFDCIGGFVVASWIVEFCMSRKIEGPSVIKVHNLYDAVTTAKIMQMFRSYRLFSMEANNINKGF